MSYAHRVGTGNREHGLVRCCKYFSVTSNKSLSEQSKTLIRCAHSGVRAYAHLRSTPMRKDPFLHVAILL